MNEQLGNTGTNSNDLLKFRNFNPINKGTMDAMDKIKSIRTKDVITINKDVLEWDDDIDGIEDIEDIEGDGDKEDDDSGEKEYTNGMIIDDDIPEPLGINDKPSIRGSGSKYNSYPFGFSGAPMAIGNSLSESLGSPDGIKPWVDLLFNIMRNQIYVFIDVVKNTNDHNIKVEINDEDFDSKSLIFNQTEEQMNEYTKKHIPKGNDLKVKDLKLSTGISTVPDGIFNFDTWEASFKDTDSYINNSIYHDVELLFEFYLPESILEIEKGDNSDEEINQFLKDNNIYTKMLGMISHEVTHLYEYYKRKLNNIHSWKDRLKGTNKIIAEKQLLSNISDDWKYFLRLIYLSLDYEINARISQLYYELSDMDIETKYDFISSLKKTQTWEEKEMVKNFDTQSFIENFSYKSSDEDIKSVFRTLDIYTQEEIETQDIKMLLLRELISIWNRSIDDTNKLYDSNMKKISETLLDNPTKFIKKFEKLFKFKADKWERKMYRLYDKIV